MNAEIEQLREQCAEAYQFIGALAHEAGVFGRPEVVKMLDNLWAAAQGEPRPHAELVSFDGEGVQPIGAK